MNAPSTKIESYAVLAVTRALDLAPLLKCEINTNDKSPSWDGFVYFYRKDDHKKENLGGRVPVQVKGTTNSKKGEKFSYRVNVSDLKNYKADGGVVYFVVHVSETLEDATVYYKTLTKLAIEKILATCSKKEKTKSITFEKLPTDVSDITEIFSNFHLHKNKQYSFDISQMRKLSELEPHSQLRFQVSTLARKDPVRSLLNNEVFAYVKEGNLDIPVMDELKITEVKSSVLCFINTPEFQYPVSIIRTRDTDSAVISNFMKFDLRKNKLSLTFSTLLREKIRQLKIWLVGVKDRQILINSLEHNDLSLKIPFEDFIDIPNEMTDEKLLTSEINQLTRFSELLEKLHVEKDLDLSQLETKEVEKLEILHRGIVLGEPIPVKDPNTKICVEKTGNLQLVILQVQNKDNPQQVNLFNIFSDQHKVEGRYKLKSKEYPTSIFSVMSVDQLATIDNLNLRDIVTSFDQFKNQNPHLCGLANQTLLNLLSAYDKSEQRCLLESATELALWIKQNFNKNQLSDEITDINLMQTYARQRQLSNKEKARLNEITTSSIESRFKVAAYLLLDEIHQAKDLWKTLSKKEKEEFMTWPISHFFDRNNTTKMAVP